MSKAVNSKWKKTFPDTIGNQNRPATGVDDTQEFETGAFPQYMANDPVRYDLQNAAMSQLMSNDARLKEMVDARGKELDDHKVDPGAHKTGIAGNAATATKVVTTAATGASANIAEASMGGSDSARIRVSGAENAGELALETANDGDEAIVARQYTGVYTNAVRTAKILDESGNTSFPGTVVAPKFTGTLNGNAATASKLATPRTLSLTGKAAGSTTFDGSANASINVTSVNADTATKATQDGAGNVITNTYLKKAGDTATGDLTAPNFVGHLKGNADTATHANDIADATMNMTVSTKENAQTTAASGVIDQLESLTGSTDLKSMSKLRSFVGSVFGPDWYNVISIRHRNGAGDGQNYGLLMYSRFENTDSIKYKKQGVNGWTEERTLLDSENYNNYAPTKTGTGASGTWGISITGNADTVDGYHASDLLNQSIRVGVVLPFSGSTIPSGCLPCNGAAVSRTTYKALFDVIGTTYGTGDGSMTFNLPDLVDKFIEGSTTAGTVKAAGLPNITGSTSGTDVQGDFNGTGAFYVSSWGNYNDQGGSYHSDFGKSMSFDASRVNSIYGNSDTVQPPAVTMQYIIKY